MKPKIFVDTDVLIDFFTDRLPFSAAATQLFELSNDQQIDIYISALSINNVYYISRRYLGHSAAIRVIKELMEMTEIVGAGKIDILEALEVGFNDFEDGIQYISAKQINKLDAILTRNIKDYKKAELAVFTPENYLKSKFNTN